MSEFIKRIFLVLLCLVLIISFSSCNSDLLSKSKFQDINFNDAQKVQLSLKGNIYNLYLSFNENNDFSLSFAPEISDALKNVKVTVSGELAIIENDGLIYKKSINEFNNDFFPKIIYLFFKNTDFSKELFNYDKEENLMSLKSKVLEKTVVFDLRLSTDNNEQIYLLEIR